MIDSHTFTQELELSNKLENEIETFWQQGEFSYFEGINGVRINYAVFKHERNTESIVISPGRIEGYLKYKELAYDLAQHNYNLFIIDHRGQGMSGRMLNNPHKGYVKKFDDYADDLKQFINEVVSAKDKIHRPHLLAHSMGGAIAIRCLQKFPNIIQSAVLSSPMVAINRGNLPSWLATTLINTGNVINSYLSNDAWYFIGQSNYQAAPFEENALSHSSIRHQEFIKLYHQAPEIQLGGVTIHWLKQAIETQQTIFDRLNEIKAPILVMQAGEDTIVDNNAQDEFCQQLHVLNTKVCPNGKPLLIKGAKHELFFEQDQYRNKAIAAALSWFKKHSTI